MMQQITGTTLFLEVRMPLVPKMIAIKYQQLKQKTWRQLYSKHWNTAKEQEVQEEYLIHPGLNGEPGQSPVEKNSREHWNLVFYE